MNVFKSAKRVTSILAAGVVMASCASEPTITTEMSQSSVLSCRVEAIKQELFENHDSGILVAAHRGHHVDVPENSIPSITSAYKIGADIVELDVLVSKDGVPFLLHDETLDRTTTGTGKASDLTISELKALHLRDLEGHVTEEQIPTLREALEAARGKVFVNVDLKSTDVNPILETIRSVNMIDQVMFYNSDLDVRDAILEISPTAIVMPIARESSDIERMLNLSNLQMLHLREAYNSSEVADILNRKQIAGWTNALGEADELARNEEAEVAFEPIVSNQPDVIQTDLPEELLAYLRRQGMHWSTHDNICS